MLIIKRNNWGLGIGDWGLGIAIPNPQSPIPTQLVYLLLFNIELILLFN